MVKLTKWEKVNNAYYGEVYNHPIFPDGSRIKITNIIEDNYKEGFIYTKTIRYKLDSHRDDVLV